MPTEKCSLNDARKELNSTFGTAPFEVVLTLPVLISLAPNTGSGIQIKLTIPGDKENQPRNIEAYAYGLTLEEIAKALNVSLDDKIWDFPSIH